MMAKQIIGILICSVFIISNVPIIAMQEIDLEDNTVYDDQFYLNNIQIDASETVYRAVLIGISNYPSFGDLPYSLHEIGRFHETLLQSSNWNDSHITVLLSEGATKQQIFAAIEELSLNADENDVSLFFFVGHGGRNTTNERIIAYDESITDVELDVQFSSVLGEVIIILDSCFSGGFIEELEKPNRIVLTACGADESTYQIQDLESGIFGYFLNAFLASITKKVEPLFALTWFFSLYYSTIHSKDSDLIEPIHPRMSDGTKGLTTVIQKRTQLLASLDSILLDAVRSPSEKIWIMS